MKQTVVRYTYLPYFDGYSQWGEYFTKEGISVPIKHYNGRNCLWLNGKRYGLKTLKKHEKKNIVEIEL